MFRLLNTETNQIVNFSLDELLEEINRDRSSEWSEYNDRSTLREIVDIIEDMTEYTTVVPKI